MTAARKLPPAIPEDDPLWQKFLDAPLDREPPPEHEALALEQAGLGGFVDGRVVTAEIARRAATEGAQPRRRQRSRAR